jgi:hypothetical protein
MEEGKGRGDIFKSRVFHLDRESSRLSPTTKPQPTMSNGDAHADVSQFHDKPSSTDGASPPGRNCEPIAFHHAQASVTDNGDQINQGVEESREIIG